MKLNNINFGKKTKETTNYKKEFKRNIKTHFVSSAAASAVLLAGIPLALVSMAGMQKISKGLTAEQKVIINKAADKALIDSGLARKGVEIIDVAKNGFSEKSNNKLVSFLKNLFNKKVTTKNGNNAFFNNINNKIFINRDKLPLSVFHEMGHSKNFNMSKITKALQSLRKPAMDLGGSMAFLGTIIRPEEAKDGKELTKLQKINNFARKHIGLLTCAAMSPIIAEECLASIKGAQLAKSSNLPKELLSKIKLTNAIGAISYITATALMAIAAKTAVKTADKCMEKYKAENK